MTGRDRRKIFEIYEGLLTGMPQEIHVPAHQQFSLVFRSGELLHWKGLLFMADTGPRGSPGPEGTGNCCCAQLQPAWRGVRGIIFQTCACTPK